MCQLVDLVTQLHIQVNICSKYIEGDGYEDSCEKDSRLQQNGAVFVAYNIGAQRIPTLYQMKEQSNFSNFMMNGIPFSISIQHICYNDYQQHILLNGFLKLQNIVFAWYI